MKATRRTLLKGTTGLAASLALTAATGRVMTAQSAVYEARMIYQYTEFMGDSYSFFDDGSIFGVSAEGVIVGCDIVDGKNVPCTWTLAGVRLLLDTGDIEFTRSRGLHISGSGKIAGTLLNHDSPAVGVSWASGGPVVLNGPTATSIVNVEAINDAGVIVGDADGMATRWTDGGIEQQGPVDGAETSTALAIAPNGDAFIFSFVPNIGFSAPQRWRVDGTVEDIPLPVEITSPPSAQITDITFPGAFDDGVVMSISMIEEGIPSGGTWLWQQGILSPIQPLSETAFADVHVAPTVDHMVGWIRGSGPDYGPAEWIAGVPGSLISKTTIPPEIQIGFFIGITSDGVLVAKNQLSDGLSAGIVGLFPVS